MLAIKKACQLADNNDIILIEWSNLIEQLLPSNINIVNFEHISENKIIKF